MSLVEPLDFPHVDGPAGSLVIAEAERIVPFEIRRVYYLHGVPEGSTRGGHAHRELIQIAVCVKGSCKFWLDDGRDVEEVVLASPHRGIILRPMVWHEMSCFSSDCVLMVLASQHYAESDYIRNYQVFKRGLATR